VEKLGRLRISHARSSHPCQRPGPALLHQPPHPAGGRLGHPGGRTSPMATARPLGLATPPIARSPGLSSPEKVADRFFSGISERQPTPAPLPGEEGVGSWSRLPIPRSAVRNPQSSRSCLFSVPSAVAQSCTLPYRTPANPVRSGEFCRAADYKSAIQEIANLRYASPLTANGPLLRPAHRGTEQRSCAIQS